MGKIPTTLQMDLDLDLGMDTDSTCPRLQHTCFCSHTKTFFADDGDNASFSIHNGMDTNICVAYDVASSLSDVMTSMQLFHSKVSSLTVSLADWLHSPSTEVKRKGKVRTEMLARTHLTLSVLALY